MWLDGCVCARFKIGGWEGEAALGGRRGCVLVHLLHSSHGRRCYGLSVVGAVATAGFNATVSLLVATSTVLVRGGRACACCGPLERTREGLPRLVHTMSITGGLPRCRYGMSVRTW